MVFALVFGVLLVSCPAFAVQGGFSRPYTHYADDEDLTVILTNFARSQGLGASFSPGVVGKVSGRFDAVPPETFLKGMQAAFGVNGIGSAPPSIFTANRNCRGRSSPRGP